MCSSDFFGEILLDFGGAFMGLLIDHDM